LHAGTYQLTATYVSDTNYSPSTSSAKTLTVTKAATSTGFTLSADPVKAGHEQAEHITVTVKPATSGTPAGTVVIKAGSAGICTITLHGAKGSCTLSASKLRPGTYQVTASYHGATDYDSSSSPARKLTVTK
jgi:hypothetical protein